MFTIKYIYPTGQEMICGPYKSIHAEFVDADGNSYPVNTLKDDEPQARWQIVYAYEEDGKSMTFHPNYENNGKIGRVYVMNSNGATIAKYEL